MPTRVRSFSKINLGLAIGPLRGDGFHALTTLYQTLEAHDVVTVSAQPLPTGESSRITLESNDRRVPLDARNTVWKMLTLALAVEPFAAGRWAVQVNIHKRLPMQGGLGAGSANAAAALLGLEREVDLSLGGAERLRIAAAVGSDVPLFLIGGTVLGLGRGEQVFPMPDLVAGSAAGHTPDAVAVVLALPGMGVSTPQAFRDWDAPAAAIRPAESQQEALGLTPAPSSDRLEELSRALAAALCESHTSSGVFPAIGREGLARQPLSALVRTGIRNDFEEVVFRQHPFLGTIKRALLGLDDESAGVSAPASGVLHAALSGSGSALFGLYGSGRAALHAEARLQALGVRTMRTRILSRAAYWDQMFVPAPAAAGRESGGRE
jgi:4-diphosphocytidyl-2-C-methyl-D-erythritol kinase